MKNKQIIIFSLIGIAVLAAVVALLLLTEPKDEGNTNDTGSSVQADDDKVNLIEKTAADVQKLTITNSSGSFDITPDGKAEDGSLLWTIADIASAPLLQSTFSTAVGNAVSVTGAEVVEENAADLAKYGLDKPKSSYTAQFGDGTSFTLHIGSDVPNSATKTYVRADGSDTVYVYKSSKLTCYGYDKFGFVDPLILAGITGAESPDIQKLTIERKDLEEPIVIEMLPEPAEDEISVFSYTLTSPYNVYLDLNSGAGYLYGMYGLTANKVAWVGMEEKDYELSGLNDPNCVVTMLVGGKTYTLKIGRGIATTTTAESGMETTAITGYYAMFSEIPDVLFEIGATSMPFMTMQASDCMSKLFLLPYINKLDKVVYKDSERELEFDLELVPAEGEDKNPDNNVFLNGEQLNSEKFKELYQFMIAARGEDIYTEPERGEFIVSLTYVYADGTPSDTVEFYESDDLKSIISVNGDNLFKTRQMYTTRLIENVNAFLSGGTIEQNY